MKRIIEKDLFDIADRLKEIDPNYFIMYNYVSKLFEIHHRAQKGNTLCLVLPFKCLDVRAIYKVLETRVERIEQILALIEKQNELIEKRENHDIKNKVLDEADEILTLGR